MITIQNELTGVNQHLIVKDNQHLLLEVAKRAADQKAYVGFDIETHDANRHQGLNVFMNIDPTSPKYKKPKKLVFDINRTTITGFSLYIRGENDVYYVNTGHLDAQNVVDLNLVLEALSTIKQSCVWIVHNFCFEQTMCVKTWGFDLGRNYVDTMQMAVSAYNDDEYDKELFNKSDLRGISNLIPKIAEHFEDCLWDEDFTTEQQDLITQVTAKASEAEHSYNGFVKSMAYGYGLKKAVKSFFGYEQQEFVDCLGGKAHMGMLESAEVLQYGADDAYWCVRLFDQLCGFINQSNPKLLKTFFEQENPMPYIWADCWVRGWRVNEAAIEKREMEERKAYVETLRDLAKALGQLAFEDNPSNRLVQRQSKWYVGKKGDAYLRYRNKILYFIAGCTAELDDYEVAKLVSGAISSKWMMINGESDTKAQADKKPNFQHYMVQRTIFHDLCNLPFVYQKGEISTDAEARGKLIDLATKLGSDPELWIKELEKYYPEFNQLDDQAKLEVATSAAENYPTETVVTILRLLNKLTTIDTRIKLYINPYLCLTDPETKRLYPTIKSLLNTRRMASENPNAMQLSKRGESTYIRGFFLPENDDHVIVSVDWSQVELVLIGEHSRDPAFYEAYGNVPYNDLHIGAALSALRVYYPSMPDEVLKRLPQASSSELEAWKAEYPKVFVNPITNEELTAKDAYKFWRGTAGKTSNFGYWYSGSLMTVQEKLNWTTDQMWEGTENYRQTFSVAEQWRVDLIDQAKFDGYVEVFDHHRRTRYECTDEWFYNFTAKFDAYRNEAVSNFGQYVARKIQRRAGNQVVNAVIQGGCATLAKRSILALYNEINAPDSKWDAHFLMPIHDELIFSVHHSQALEFSNRIVEVMTSHQDLVSWLKLDATTSVGLTLEPYHPEKAPYGQIELDEAPELEGYIPKHLAGQKLDAKHRQAVIAYLRQEPKLYDEMAEAV